MMVWWDEAGPWRAGLGGCVTRIVAVRATAC